MKTDDFFGFNFDRRLFVLDDYLSFKGLAQEVDRRPAVREALRLTGSPEHGLVRIVRRREALKRLAPLLRQAFLPWNKYYYLKEVNTATEEDRRYGAEEALLTFALVLATGQTWPVLRETRFQPGLRVLRNMEPLEREATLMEILAEQTAEAEAAYRRRLGKGGGGWWQRLRAKLAAWLG